jgi:D-glycero-D-manno-heptose 1,7-bisphosphate phosphatase
VGNGALRRAVFLDRDGVINEAVIRDGKPYPPSLHELRIVSGAAESLTSLRDRGFALIVVTNQPDVARGSTTQREVDEIHQRLAAALPIDAFFVCPHDDSDDCTCRKPLPGMLVTAAAEHGIDLAGSFMIGDRWKDIAAGRSAGVRTAFIDRGYAEPPPEPPADVTVSTLQGAVEWILNREPQ